MPLHALQNDRKRPDMHDYIGLPPMEVASEVVVALLYASAMHSKWKQVPMGLRVTMPRLALHSVIKVKHIEMGHIEVLPLVRENRVQ